MTAIVLPVDFTTRILIVDDDEAIRELVAGFLVQHGYQADAVGDAASMRAALAARTYQLIVLDVMMPGEDGLAALRGLQATGGPPVIMLSAVGGDVDRIIGLELGADDYLVKPCNPRELLARIRTVLRRAAPPAAAAREEDSAAFLFDGWRLDLLSRALSDPTGRAVSLTDGEFRLLRAFLEHPRRIVSRDQLLDYSRGEEAETYDRAIDVQVSRLRRKLAQGAGGDALITTARSEGYIFAARVVRT